MSAGLLPFISLIGERAGRLKDLAEYRKPSGFGGRQSADLGSAEVAKAGEELFASIRAAMGYKRKEIAFSHDGRSGLLVCRDFDLALEFELPAEEEGYCLRRTLTNLKAEEIFKSAPFNELFASTFQRLELRSASPVRVEEWIDRIEDLDLETEWQLQYPPDYSHCTLRVPGSEFEIRIASEKLAMTRLLPAPPSEFWASLLKLNPLLATPA